VFEGQISRLSCLCYVLTLQDMGTCSRIIFKECNLDPGTNLYSKSSKIVKIIIKIKNLETFDLILLFIFF